MSIPFILKAVRDELVKILDNGLTVGTLRSIFDDVKKLIDQLDDMIKDSKEKGD